MSIWGSIVKSCEKNNSLRGLAWSSSTFPALHLPTSNQLCLGRFGCFNGKRIDTVFPFAWFPITRHSNVALQVGTMCSLLRYYRKTIHIHYHATTTTTTETRQQLRPFLCPWVNIGCVVGGIVNFDSHFTPSPLLLIYLGCCAQLVQNKFMHF